MANPSTFLHIQIETVETNPFFRLFSANGEKLDICLDYVSGQGEAARGTFDTYRQAVTPGGYWLIISYGDRATLSKVTALESAQSVNEKICEVGGCVSAEAVEAFAETRAKNEIPSAVADAFTSCFAAIETYYRRWQAHATAIAPTTHH